MDNLNAKVSPTGQPEGEGRNEPGFGNARVVTIELGRCPVRLAITTGHTRSPRVTHTAGSAPSPRCDGAQGAG